jgi:hypothetical protein
MTSTCPKCQKPVSIPSGVDLSAAVRCPCCQAEYALNEALGPTPPELIPVGLVDAAHVEGESQPDSELENEAAAVAKQFAAMPVTARRKRKPKSALQTLIEVVAGGLAGCLVAYYALAFYWGPEFRTKGLPQLPLPGIAWITAPRAADDAKDKPKGEKPAKTKPQATHDGESDTRSSCSPRQNGIQFV